MKQFSQLEVPDWRPILSPGRSDGNGQV